MTMRSLDLSKWGKMLRKWLRSSEVNNSHRIDIKSKRTAYGKTDVLRLTKCRKKVKIAKNQAETDVAKYINRNSKKNETNKTQQKQYKKLQTSGK